MSKRAWRLVRRVAVAAAVLVGALLVTARLAGFGCARKPDRLADNPTPVPVGDLMAGNWEGKWTSSQRDMGGKLTCRIRKLGEGEYRAEFDAVFGGIFNNHSVVTLRVRSKGAAWEFSGQEDLGFLKGGVYKYQGKADGREFTCGYDSKYDKGTFTMSKVGP